MFWSGVVLLFASPLAVGCVFMYFVLSVWWRYVPRVLTIFQTTPLFVVPRGLPVEGGEAVRFPSLDGRMLNGCYLKGQGARRGVILFGLEFGSNCWSSQEYCTLLLESGYDVFAFEPRSQGDSDKEPGYEPLHWVTDFEVMDTRAAIAYLRGRPDADPFGVGFFGISKGAGAGLIAGADDPYVLCFVTDGVFGTLSTTVPYMRHFFRVYNKVFPKELLEDWFLAGLYYYCAWRIGRLRGCRYPSLERAMPRLAPRGLMMIHGECDTYIKTEMARSLLARAGGPKELWVVPEARHNQALHVAGEGYTRRVLAFFDRHLAADTRAPAITAGPGGV